MTDKWISDGRQRRSRKYLAKHAELARDIAEDRARRSKAERHNRHVGASAEFRQTGSL